MAPLRPRSALAATLPLLVVLALLLPRRLAEAKDLGSGWQEKTNEQGKVVQQLKIEAPAMTEEDQYGYTMPERYRCDSCKAVMFHLDRDLKKKHPKSRRMKQWEYTDAFDETCRGGFEGYGIRLVDGENALSGPGLPRDERLAPGSGAIQMSSENWSKRLGEVCRKIVYEQVGEDEVYERFYKKFRAEASGGAEAEAEIGLTEALCTKELRECVSGPKPPPPPAKPETKPASAAAKAKQERRAQKKAAAAAAAAKPAAEPAKAAAGASAEKVDVQTFLRGLAVRHGLTSDEYLAARTAAEWEKLAVAIAGRLFNHFVEQPPAEETCGARA